METDPETPHPGAKPPLTNSSVETLVKESARLLAPAEAGLGFAKDYFEALQRDPDVVLAHGEVTRLSGWRKTKREDQTS